MARKKKLGDIPPSAPYSDADTAEQSNVFADASRDTTLPRSRELHCVLTPSDSVIFPGTLSPLTVDSPRDVEIVETACKENRLLAVFNELTMTTRRNINVLLGSVKDPGIELTSSEINGRSCATRGVLVRVVKTLRLPDGNLRILVRGLQRITYFGTSTDPESLNRVYVTRDRDEVAPNDEESALVASLIRFFSELIDISPFYPDDLKMAMENIDSPVRIADAIADALTISNTEKLAVLILENLSSRCKLLMTAVTRELSVAQLSTDIQKRVHESINQHNKEHYLREQMEVIRRELNDEASENPDIAAFKERCAKMNLPPAVMAVYTKELDRLNAMPPASPEYGMCANYIDWLLSLPWNAYSCDTHDIAAAARILDEDHYGLADVKERILEFLSVLQLRDSQKAPILCFVGPPGVGKTSLGKSIAKAMNRSFVRVSLGGVRDEADIRGHRRTYIGALPGRIIAGMKRAATSNPIFMLDEVDKLANDSRGDPSSALLEVLDPEQNCAFNDHFIEVDYDLSSVFFIATANLGDMIPAPLYDRMEVITLSGYTVFEKQQIAEKFLIPRQLKENGLTPKQLAFASPAITEIISYYTSEAGVRNLERVIAKVCRKYARKVVQKEVSANKLFTLKKSNVHDFLGARTFLHEEGKRPSEVGVATGLAWTADGGCVLPVECTRMPGKGELKLTGSLGDVMKESAMAALSYLKAHAAFFKIDPKRFAECDIHIHVPDGATPKDGPSAGVTIAATLYSALTDAPISAKYAMTGEINLRGKVTAIGGVKEKSIAALRSGITEILIPSQNEKDLEKIPEEIRKKIHFHPVETIQEAFGFLFKTFGTSARPRKK